MKLFLPLLFFLVPVTYTHHTHAFLWSSSIAVCNTTARSIAPKIHALSLQNIALKGAASLFGVTVMSYACIAYFFYRVYTLLAKMSAWLAWNEQVHEHDMIEEAKQYLARTHQEQEQVLQNTKNRSIRFGTIKYGRDELQKQKKLLEDFMVITRLLERYNLNYLTNFFEYDKNKQKQVEYALALITLALETDKILLN